MRSFRFPLDFRVTSAHADARPEAAHRDRSGPVPRLTCAAVIMLAAAGCSQEVQRLDYDERNPERAQLHYNEERYAEDGFSSWRRAERGALRERRADPYRDPITRSLPERPRSPRRDERYGRAESQREGRPRAPRRQTHTVREGDTLYSIAQRHDVDVEALARVNRLNDPGLIRVGDTLYIPGPGYQPRQRREKRQYAGGRPSRSGDDGRAMRRRARNSDDDLYTDPLLRDRPSRRDRRNAEPPRERAERPAPRRRSGGRTMSESGPDERRDPRSGERRSRISSARPQRASRTAPPPAPAQRPEERPSQIARSEAKPAQPTIRSRTGQRSDAGKAECGDLLKNPPARSGANFRRPVNGLIVSHYGEQSDGRRNDGINISVPRGTRVKAAENGVVVYAGDELTGLGKLVLVRHAGGWVSAYAHNDEILVSRCDTVERGQTVAKAGVSGSVTKPQLHFELRKNAQPVDPEPYLAGTS